jgi:hypothetical protein
MNPTYSYLVSQSILLAAGKLLYLANIFLDKFGLTNLNKNKKKRKLMHAAGKYLLSNSIDWGWAMADTVHHNPPPKHRQAHLS